MLLIGFYEPILLDSERTLPCCVHVPAKPEWPSPWPCPGPLSGVLCDCNKQLGQIRRWLMGSSVLEPNYNASVKGFNLNQMFSYSKSSRNREKYKFYICSSSNREQRDSRSSERGGEMLFLLSSIKGTSRVYFGFTFTFSFLTFSFLTTGLILLMLNWTWYNKYYSINKNTSGMNEWTMVNKGV